MTDERQKARAQWIRAYSAGSAALGRAARTQAAHVVAQNDDTQKQQVVSLGLEREFAADALDKACMELREAALVLHGFAISTDSLV